MAWGAFSGFPLSSLVIRRITLISHSKAIFLSSLTFSLRDRREIFLMESRESKTRNLTSRACQQVAQKKSHRDLQNFHV